MGRLVNDKRCFTARGETPHAVPKKIMKMFF